MNEKMMKNAEISDAELEQAVGGCEDHDPNYYAVIPPCVRCAYKYMESQKPCPCCGASWEEQIGGF
ncbi:MAG: hypothetical protein IJ313_06805 [Clostridia bacterium]|nr:hypothetical protein [Clostridia bacterium]